MNYDYELIDHGIDGCQYFTGCGVAYTSYSDVVTGCGENFAEALDDCLDSIAQDSAIDTTILEAQIREDEGYVGKPWPTEPSATAVCEKCNQDQADEDGEFPQEFYDGLDSYYYVSIRWNKPVPVAGVQS
jgi:hypothetical protein